MLSSIYGLETEISSLFFTISALSFVFGTPITFQLRKRKLASRRSIIYVALSLMGLAMIIRTGNLRGNEVIHWVYTSQILNGMSLGMLTTTTFPEIVDAVERTPMFSSYEKDEVHIYISGLFV